jgi:hypothetical protein
MRGSACALRRLCAERSRARRSSSLRAPSAAARSSRCRSWRIATAYRIPIQDPTSTSRCSHRAAPSSSRWFSSETPDISSAANPSRLTAQTPAHSGARGRTPSSRASIGSSANQWRRGARTPPASTCTVRMTMKQAPRSRGETVPAQRRGNQEREKQPDPDRGEHPGPRRIRQRPAEEESRLAAEDHQGEGEPHDDPGPLQDLRVALAQGVGDPGVQEPHRQRAPQIRSRPGVLALSPLPVRHVDPFPRRVHGPAPVIGRLAHPLERPVGLPNCSGEPAGGSMTPPMTRSRHFALGVATLLLLPASASGDGWPMRGANPRRTGHSETAGPERGDRVWSAAASTGPSSDSTARLATRSGQRCIRV